MIRAYLFIILISCISCKKNKKLTISYFEISYLDDWEAKEYSFKIDSSRTNFISIKKTGKLNEIFNKMLDTSLSEILKDTSMNYCTTRCSDCAFIAIKTIIDKEEYKFFQCTDINPKLYRLHENINNFLDTVKKEITNETPFWETQEMITGKKGGFYPSRPW